MRVSNLAAGFVQNTCQITVEVVTKSRLRLFTVKTVDDRASWSARNKAKSVIDAIPMQAEKLEARQVYQRKVEAQLGQLNTQIIELKAKVSQLKLNAEIRQYDKINALSKKQQEAQIKLQMLKSANEDTWPTYKVEMESALHELQDVFNNALSQFKRSQFKRSSQSSSQLI